MPLIAFLPAITVPAIVGSAAHALAPVTGAAPTCASCSNAAPVPAIACLAIASRALQPRRAPAFNLYPNSSGQLSDRRSCTALALYLRDPPCGSFPRIRLDGPRGRRIFST